tara:strand:- start:53 stop:271 length:219 start_codon:yes stop_codon:yes gene_type:complete
MGINVEVVTRKGEDPNRAIKRFIKKCKKENFLKDIIERSRHTKSSVKRRQKKIRRKKVMQKLRHEREKENRS